MLAIGRALLTNPKCLVLDEPFEGLAPALVEEVGDVLRALRSEGIGVLLIEQQVEAALAIADRVYVMGKGVIVFEGPVEAFTRRKDIQATYLGVSG
jgi:branched-chain amino acid transport system ATP-binding protein